MRLAVISPFLDRSHGTERCIVEQLERFALQPGAEIHIYAQRVQDLRGVTPYQRVRAAKATDHRVETKTADRLLWHKVPSIPGPHLLQYIFWFVANRICRWWDAAFHYAEYDLLYSPGINATDADAISVHVVFHEFYRQVLPQLSFRKTPLTSWPRLAHRRAYYRLIMALENRIYRRTTVSLAAISASAATLLEKYFQPAAICVIRHGVDVQAFSVPRRLAERPTARTHFKLSAEDFALLLIGNDWRTKGLAALLQSLALIRELPWKLLVVGKDIRDPYDKMIRDYGIANRIFFFPPSPHVMEFYAAADAYVGPSAEDAYGLPIIEAMATGLPVIASSRAGAHEIITDGSDGIILRDPQNAGELAAGLRSLITDPALCRQLGEHATHTAQNHTWDRNAESTWGWLNEVAREKKKAQRDNCKSRREIDLHTSSFAAQLPEVKPCPQRPLPALTGVRFFAAFYVVLGHSLPWLDQHVSLPWPVKTFLGNGYLAVALFFLLSGFILAYTYEDQIVGVKNRVHFFEARFARIYPVYLLSLILAYWFERGLHVGTRIAVLAMVQAWNPLAPAITGAWNYPAWTLSVEAFFYLCFPLVLPWLSRQSNIVLRSAGVILLFVSVLAHTPVKGLGAVPSGGLIPLPLWRLPEFLLGIILGLLFLRSLPRQEPPRFALTSISIAGCFLALSLPLGSWVSIVMIPYAMLIFELACGNSWWARILSTRLMLLLGGASYAIYLLQFPVRSWTRTIFLHLPTSLQPFGAPLTPLILVLFSILVFRFWEEPARRTLRRWFTTVGKS
ncbi:MAG: hypothetical protein QOJ41_2242 [Acidobacteriaceae bacterium]|nr:hypothetical protein [Acidobacteriaceae bacterium]